MEWCCGTTWSCRHKALPSRCGPDRIEKNNPGQSLVNLLWNRFPDRTEVGIVELIRSQETWCPWSSKTWSCWHWVLILRGGQDTIEKEHKQKSSLPWWSWIPTRTEGVRRTPGVIVEFIQIQGGWCPWCTIKLPSWYYSRHFFCPQAILWVKKVNLWQINAYKNNKYGEKRRLIKKK